MTRFSAEEFVAYFTALHGYGPFPWQKRLVKSVLETGKWPALLDIPTGLGKTSTVDIALFVLSSRPDVAPRRTITVVDRRVIVDQGAAHARKILQQLTEAETGILRQVAGALRELWDAPPDALPFEVAVLRGGMPRDEAWAARPDRPVVAFSTVDQVGSRLLFRGYGVSRGMAPIHAGLLGHDALILLDEVQLSTAFAETLAAVDTRWRGWSDGDVAGNAIVKQIPNRWAFVRMSATPLGNESTPPFGLEDEDYAHPEVQKRRSANKPAILGDLIATNKTDSDKTQQAIAAAFSEVALRYLKEGARRIAVIVNRVASARQIHAEVLRRVNEATGLSADVVLLTGRMRPLDRTRIFENEFDREEDRRSIMSRIKAGAKSSATQVPVIVVSTQTIEAGADFDFDALVTECASIDAMRQRFGRLDRRGDQGGARATILIRKDNAADSSDDPVYGAALGRTWAWLEQQGGTGRIVDFGIAAFPVLSDEQRIELCSALVHAPVLLPAHVDAWAQTNPPGEPDPEVALWLHGPRRGTAEVRVVWRADLDSIALSNVECERDVTRYASASLGVAPPSSLESVSVPLAAFRAWIAVENEGDIADVEGVETDERNPQRNRKRQRSRPFMIAKNSGATLHRDDSELYPEATVVVPSSYGGILHGNWDPEAKEPVRDLGDLSQLLHRERPVLRLVPGVLNHELIRAAHGNQIANVMPSSQAPEGDNERGLAGLEVDSSTALSAPLVPIDDAESDFDPRVAIGTWLESSVEHGSTLWNKVAEVFLKSARTPGASATLTRNARIVQLDGSRHFALTYPRIAGGFKEEREGVDSTSSIVNDDDDSASYIGREVTLKQHLSDVERWSTKFAVNLGLPEGLANDLALAARLHDLGKADPRFQRMLHGGSEVRAAASEDLLAKSNSDASNQAAREEARRRAGYPERYRHELLSVAMLQENEGALSRAFDSDLVLHLVGSHHGWCRPFAPAVDPGPALSVEWKFDEESFSADAAHGLALLDSGVSDRYFRLTERYGWWTLAWLEALVRLADHRASEESAAAETDSTKKKRGN